MEHRAVGRGSFRPRTRPVPELDDVIYGVHAVEEALLAGERLRHVHVAAERKRDPAVRNLLEQARERQIHVRYEERPYFAQFPYKAHQGIIAFGPPFAYAALEDILNAPRVQPLLLAVLDHVTDPHNLGAIIRTAECAGASGAVLPERRAAGVNATVRKAAAGAAAHLPIARVSNIAQAVRTLKKADVWVAGASTSPRAVQYTRADFLGDVAFVIGAEGPGLSQLVERECDYLVRVPVAGRTPSLNASVAAAVLFYEAVRQREKADGAS